MNNYNSIHITSDTHGLRHIDGVRQWAAAPGLSRQDLLLIAGDTEIINYEHGSAVLEAFAALPCDVAVIDGNHDDYPAMCSRPAVSWCGGPAHRLAPNVVALRRGEIYTPAGISIWAFGGAMMEGYVPVQGAPVPGELPTGADYDRGKKSLLYQRHCVDIILTHDGSEEIVGARKYDPVRPFLQWVYENVSFGQWIYGHHHRNVQGAGNTRCVYEEVETIYRGAL